MAKQLKDILKGVQASKLSKGSLGKDPGVDYQPKAGDEARFADKHMVQKHENRAGNKDDVFNATNIKYALDDKKKEPRHGRKKGDDQDVYEAVEKENTKCNMSEAGTMCEVHGMANCKKVKPLTEKDEDEKEDSSSDASKTDKDVDDFVSMSSNLKKRIEGASDPAEKERLQKQHSLLMKIPNRIPEEVELDEEGNDEYKADLPNTHKEPKAKKKSPSSSRGEYGSAEMRRLGKALERKTLLDLSGGLAQKRMKEEAIDEVLTKDQPAAEWIKDFVDSDNPKFEGKSKKKRTEMALAAYYSKQREKKN